MNRLRRLLSLQLVLLLSLLAGSVGVAQAHVLKQDNGMSAVLHIPPEDNPKAGQPTELDVTFYNQQNTFDINDCRCGVSVTDNNGKTIQTTKLQPYLTGATLNTKTTVNFPKIGIYHVIISGSALNGAFGAFRLDYLERVATNADGTGGPSNAGGSEALIVGAAALVIVAMFGYNGVTSGGRYTKAKAKAKTELKAKPKLAAKPAAKAAKAIKKGSK